MAAIQTKMRWIGMLMWVLVLASAGPMPYGPSGEIPHWIVAALPLIPVAIGLIALYALIAGLLQGLWPAIFLGTCGIATMALMLLTLGDVLNAVETERSRLQRHVTGDEH